MLINADVAVTIGTTAPSVGTHMSATRIGSRIYNTRIVSYRIVSYRISQRTALDNVVRKYIVVCHTTLHYVTS